MTTAVGFLKFTTVIEVNLRRIDLDLYSRDVKS